MTITVLPGRGKQGQSETYASMLFSTGEMTAIVGDTGSGKTRLIKDIEQFVCGDSVTSRTILVDGHPIPRSERASQSDHLIAHLGQNMRFTLDLPVDAFIQLHAACRESDVQPEAVIALANEITPEPMAAHDCLNLLSGGQARALMIADIALVCQSPIVLIDEIENAGLDKEKAFACLKLQDKLVFAVTHDVHTALMAEKRVVLSGGAVTAYHTRTQGEEVLYQELSRQYQRQQALRAALRKGDILA